ncbi:hypothetical protein X797_010504 [Metarhizium robertsii]|uniref:Uncharacterized protein n=1 Tax=Metarhizium robertsii TaxID=568076 RepID=A0A014P4A5_9HYPO|nr:hypothetical protein X797_010504 [Metarhizium robertsii]
MEAILCIVEKDAFRQGHPNPVHSITLDFLASGFPCVELGKKRSNGRRLIIAMTSSAAIFTHRDADAHRKDYTNELFRSLSKSFWTPMNIAQSTG